MLEYRSVYQDKDFQTEPSPQSDVALLEGLGRLGLEGGSLPPSYLPNTEGLNFKREEVLDALAEVHELGQQEWIQRVNEPLRQTDYGLKVDAHQRRVAAYVAMYLNRHAGTIDPNLRRTLLEAALVHDVGKAVRPELYAGGKWDANQRLQGESHPADGVNRLLRAGINNPALLYFVAYHHDEIIEQTRNGVPVRPYADRRVPVSQDEQVVWLRQLLTRCDEIDALAYRRPEYQDAATPPPVVIQEVIVQQLQPAPDDMKDLLDASVKVRQVA